MQPPSRQIDEIALKLSERARSEIRLFRTLKHIVGARILNEHVGAPVVPSFILHERTVRERAQQPQRPLAGLLAAAADLVQQMGRDPVDVLHDLFRFLEHGVIAPQNRVVQSHAARSVGVLLGVVAVSVSEWNRDQ